MRRVALILALALQASAALSQTAPLAVLRSPDVGSGVEFGRAVAVSGGIAAVGGPGAEQQGGLTPGAVTLFERGADGVWSRRQRLVPSGFGQGRAEEAERFGVALALEGTRLAVGASGDDDGGRPEAGAVYLYERRTDGTWVEAAVLRDPEPTASGAFGSAVALSGSRLMVTASGNRADGAGGTYRGGTVYVFERDIGGSWAVRSTLRRPAVEGSVAFGSALALDGARALIGARGSDASPVNVDGRAYVYELTGTTWRETSTLESPDPRVAGANKRFGEAVALEGDLALVGAWGQGVQVGGLGSFASGVAYLYQRSESGAWRLRQRLVPDDLDRTDLEASRQIQFGYSVALESDRAVVGARRDDIGAAENAGSVYVFANVDGVWRQRTKLRGSGEASTEFGTSTALSDRTVVTGEVFGGTASGRSGIAYVHTSERIAPPPPPGPTPPPPVKLVMSETVGVSDGSGLRESLQLLMQESIGVRDATGLRESLRLLLQESVGVNDGPYLRASVQLLLQETVGVNDAPDLRNALQLFLQETVGVREEADLRASLRLFLRETVGVADASGLRASLEMLVQESIHVLDDPGLAGALALLIQERVGVSDGTSLAWPDSSLASGAYPVLVDAQRVTFLGPVGLSVDFSGVGDRGSVSVFFEEAPPEAPAGIPAGATLAPYRWTLRAADSLAFDSVRVAFDPRVLPRLAITDGTAITVYQRPASGEGTFAALPTTLDPDTGEIVGHRLIGLGEVTLAGTGFTVGTEEDGPAVFGISTPTPNPARALTRIVLSLSEPGAAQVDVLDLRGRRVATLVQGELPAGRTSLQIRANTFAAGSYVVVFRSRDQVAITRLTVVR